MPGANCARCAAAGPSSEAGDVLPLGSMLYGKFRIGCLLGRGGFGTTYLAWDTNLEVRVAIKEFFPQYLAMRVPGATRVSPQTGKSGAYDQGLKQFLDEARNLAQFRDHACIVSVLEFFSENGTGYMVMEYLDGRTLLQYVDKSGGTVETDTAMRLLVPVADALRACHAVRLIHRDISPDNIFLTDDGRVKLLDFGAARLAVSAESIDLSVVLKHGYAPLEQYQAKGRQGPWTDVYALCATLYRIVTGEVPPQAPDRIDNPSLTFPARAKGLPQAVKTLIGKGMAMKVADRYQTVDELLTELRAVLNMTVESPGRSDAARQGGVGKSWKAAAGLVAGGALAASVAGLVILRPPTGTGQSPMPPQQSPDGGGKHQSDLAVEGQVDLARNLIGQCTTLIAKMARTSKGIQAAEISLDQIRLLASEAETVRRFNAVLASLRPEMARNEDGYLSGVRALTSLDPGQVDAAFDIERQNAAGATALGSLKLLSDHLNKARQRTLTREIITTDLNLFAKQILGRDQ